LKYKNGRELGSDVISAVRYVTKVGVMSRVTWYALFGRGNLRWKQTQWKFLIDSKIFRPYPCDIIEDVVALGTYGRRLVAKNGWKYSVSFQPSEIHHDEKVGIGLWKLERADLIKKWMHQKEIKRKGLDSMKLQIRKKSYKYPDAIFLFENQGKEEVAAIEYEARNQGYYRYLPMLKAYQESANFDRILFVVPDKSTKKSIQKVMNTIRDETLVKKVGFIDAEIWNSNPVIHLGRSVPATVPEAQTSVA